MIRAGADPTDPENVMGFLSGLLTGQGNLFVQRLMVGGKSTLTGRW
jgi:aldehyde:ferredoxin oxidoreductase